CVYRSFRFSPTRRSSELFLDEGNTGFDGLAGAADLLDVHRAQPAGKLLLGHQAADLVHLAAEAEHDHVGEIDMARIAAERAAKQDRKSTRLNSSHVSTSY